MQHCIVISRDAGIFSYDCSCFTNLQSYYRHSSRMFVLYICARDFYYIALKLILGGLLV